MDIVAIERDLTAFLAGKLQKSVDADIFRSQIPTGRRCNNKNVFLLRKIHH